MDKNKKDKIEIAAAAIATAAIVIYGKMKQRSQLKSLNYQKVEVEIPFGCKNLKDLCWLESELSRLTNDFFWKIRHMNWTSNESKKDEDDYHYDEEDKEDNKEIVKEMQEELDYLKTYVKDKITKRVPSPREVKNFMLYATKTVKKLDNLKNSVKELEKEKDDKGYNAEYRKAVNITLAVCRQYLKVYSQIIKIMDKYLKTKENDSNKNESIEFLYEELLHEFSLFNKKKIPPKVIDEDFLKKLKNTDIPNKQVKLKKCKVKGIYKCDVSIEKINSMISTFIKVSKKWKEALPKYFVKNFPPEMFESKFNDETQTFSATPPANEKERRDILNVLGVKDTDIIEKSFLNSSDIFKNYENIQTKDKYNVSVNSSSLVKLTEDYLKLKEITESDKFQRLVEGFERFKKEEKLISARIASGYKMETDSEYITNIERFLGEDILDMFYHPVYYGKFTIQTVINYKSALGDIIRRLYKEC